MLNNDLNTEYDRGVDFISKGDYDRGIAIIKQNAIRGHIPSQRGLAIGYKEGIYGLPVDYSKSVELFTIALRANDPESCYHLGHMYLDGKGVQMDVKKAIEHLRKSADLGLDVGQLTIAEIFYFGQYGQQKDYELAEKYYSLAQQQGDDHSSYMLGQLKLFAPAKNADPYIESKKLFRQVKVSRFSKEAETMLNVLRLAKIQPTHNKVWSLQELCEKLSAEDQSNFYYRGQATFYGHPLRPSAFRAPHSEYPINYSGPCRLRGTGENFYFENSTSRKEKGPQVKQILSWYTNNALGYPLTQALFQQAGYTSEGLDITSDPTIGLFFSTYDYKMGNFYIDETKEYSVIYRWKLSKQSVNETLQNDFYSCPSLIPTKDILQSFNTCGTYREFKESLEDYRRAIDWDDFFYLDNIRGKRPFHLLKLPKQMLPNCRISFQKGSLLLPDVVLPESRIRAEPSIPRYMPKMMKQMVEDLSDNENCDVFIFKRDNKFALEKLKSAHIAKEDIYNEEYEDISHELLYGWVESLYGSIRSSGGMPIELNSRLEMYGLTYNDVLKTIREWQQEKKSNGYFWGN